MKAEFFVEFNGNSTDYKTLIDAVKNIWKADDKKVKDLESVDIYFKPEENMCYYIINGTIKGSFNVN